MAKKEKLNIPKPIKGCENMKEIVATAKKEASQTMQLYFLLLAQVLICLKTTRIKENNLKTKYKLYVGSYTDFAQN